MHATAVIEDYLHGLHEAMEPWFGQWFAPSCCGPFGRIRQSGIRATPARPRLKRVDSLTDTMTDAAPLLGVAYGA
jgi:hypothetical protein